MKVANAIELLSALKPDDDIVICWWEKSCMDYLCEDDLVLADDGWEMAVRKVEQLANDDWFGLYEQVSAVAWEYAQEPE